MIKRLIWAPMSSVLKKTDKLNLSLSHPTLYWACDYLSMLGLKLIVIVKGAPGSIILITFLFQPIITYSPNLHLLTISAVTSRAEAAETQAAQLTESSSEELQTLQQQLQQYQVRGQSLCKLGLETVWISTSMALNDGLMQNCGISSALVMEIWKIMCGLGWWAVHALLRVSA